MTRKTIFGFLVLIIALCGGCQSSKELVDLGAEDRFEVAKKKFDDGNYLDAIEDFRVITLQFTGSRVADSAQFYLAESYFHRDQFILAASEF
jgi:outer membrane protein assembly factor BamD